MEYCLNGINCRKINCKYNHSFPKEYCPNNNYCKISDCKLLHSINYNISCKHGVKCRYSHCAFKHYLTLTDDSYIKNNLCPMGVTCNKPFNTCTFKHSKYLLPNYKLLKSDLNCAFIKCSNPLCIRTHTQEQEPLRYCIFGSKCPNINICCYDHTINSDLDFTYINKLFKFDTLDFLKNNIPNQNLMVLNSNDNLNAVIKSKKVLNYNININNNNITISFSRSHDTDHIIKSILILLKQY